MVQLLGPLTPPPWPAAEAGPGWAFFLDVDGTLLEYADRPAGVHVSPELAETIVRLAHASDGAVALISGRALSDVDRLFAPLILPAAGQHGAERRQADGICHRHPVLADGLRRVVAELAGFTARHAGLLLEDKGMSVALHFRLRPELREIVESEVSRVAGALGAAWACQPGRLVYEIRPGGRDKGMAIADFMAEPPFEGRLAVFVGDDLTDEQGFIVVNRYGGLSVKVGAGETAAGWRLPDAEAVRRWLDGCVRRLAGRPPGDRR
jgi:trehalose 6-phosphate phosphatase